MNIHDIITESIESIGPITKILTDDFWYLAHENEYDGTQIWRHRDDPFLGEYIISINGNVVTNIFYRNPINKIFNRKFDNFYDFENHVEGITNDPIDPEAMEHGRNILKGIADHLKKKKNNKKNLDEGFFDNFIKDTRGAVRSTTRTVKSRVDRINGYMDKLGGFLQDTRPVKDFDIKVANLQNQIEDKFPSLAKVSEMYGDWARKNPIKQNFVIALLAIIANLAAGPIEASIAASILRAATELAKKAKASAAVGKVVKSRIGMTALSDLGHM